MALSTTAAGDVTFRTNWAELSWGNSLLDFWDDFSEDGRLDEREQASLIRRSVLSLFNYDSSQRRSKRDLSSDVAFS